MEPFRILDADWKSFREPITQIRFRVFVEEQQVPAAEELDGIDPDCRHVLAEMMGNNPLFAGTARLLPDGHIGRVAVLPAFRGRRIGEALVLRLIDLARELGHREVCLNSQESALGFYDRLGFVREGDRFYDAGIPHFRMHRKLENPFAKG